MHGSLNPAARFLRGKRTNNNKNEGNTPKETLHSCTPLSFTFQRANSGWSILNHFAARFKKKLREYVGDLAMRENGGMVHAENRVAAMRASAEPPESLREGLSRRIIRTSHLMSVVLDFEGGPWEKPEPFHSHPHEQTTYVASGEVLFCSEGSAPERLGCGDMVAIPSGVPHSIQLLSGSARLVDTFHPIREDFLPGSKA